MEAIFQQAKFDEKLDEENTFELCEPCYHKVEQKIKEFINENV